jgi:hypothetical protein
MTQVSCVLQTKRAPSSVQDTMEYLAPGTWQESREGDAVVLRFEGINQDRRDDIDAHNFGRALSAPMAEDPVGARIGVFEWTPQQVVQVMLGFAFVIVTFTLIREYRADEWTLYLLPFSFVIGFVLIPVINSLRTKRAAPQHMSASESFSIRFAERTFSLAGSLGTSLQHPLRDIVQFVDHYQRMSVELRDGTKARLPCVLLDRKHDALVKQLNQLLAESHLAIADYRGQF